MSKLKLSLVLAPNDRSQPVVDGSVGVEGVDLTISTANPGEIFFRQLSNHEWDVSEMSMSELLITTAQGNPHYVGIPVFATRYFFHTFALVRKDAGIERPQDLKGKRIGVPEYVQTAALWGRGALMHEFGVQPSDLTWFQERLRERSHGGVLGFQPPAGVELHYIPPEKSIGSMMLSGELDATLVYYPGGSLVDRSMADLQHHPDIRLLFPDVLAESARYHHETGLLPMNHCVAVRRSIFEEHPWVAGNIFRAFVQAKQIAAGRSRRTLEYYLQVGLLPLDTRGAMNADPYPYGIASNRHTLEALALYSNEQGLTPRVVGLDEVFAPTTLNL